jgi:T5SS/PEP-CTERM-associated repeat protein
MQTKQAKWGSWPVLALTLALFAGLAPRAQALERYWTSTVDGTYSDSGNWLNAQVPGGLDTAYFTNNASYAVNWNADAAVAGAIFSAASGTVTLNLGAYTWATPVTVGKAAGYSAVVQNGGTLQATNGLSVGSDGSKRGSMTVSNGGLLFTKGPNIGQGGGSGCALVVSGTGTVMEVRIPSGNSQYDNASQVVVTNGGVLRDAGDGNIYIGHFGGATSTNNTWLVTGAGSVFSNTTLGAFILGSVGSGNRLTISDGGSFYNKQFFHARSSNNQVLVTGSNSTLTLGYQTALGYNAGGYNTLTITNGGRANLMTYTYLGSVTNAPGNTIVVTGPGSLLRNGNVFQLGAASIGNRVAVRDGAQYNVDGVLGVGGGFDPYACKDPPSPWNNTVEVSGTGSLVVCTSIICVGSNKTVGAGINSSGGNFMLWNGGGVELQAGATLASGQGGTGIISNYLGGVFQFTTTTPTINNGTPGSIVINGGTVSFRAVTTASVFCNQAGQPLDSTNKMSWFGDNTFRLNTATNLAGQNYTFQTGTGTNFAGLSLINGSKYQGNVTIGTGGTLSFAGGAQTISGTLAMQSAGTLAATVASSNDYLSVTGTVNLASAQLQVTLNTDPTPLYPIRFLRTGGLGGSQFSTRTIEVQYRGTNFSMKVRYDANTQDVLLYDAGVKGTLLLMY